MARTGCMIRAVGAAENCNGIFSSFFCCVVCQIRALRSSPLILAIPNCHRVLSLYSISALYTMLLSIRSLHRKPPDIGHTVGCQLWTVQSLHERIACFNLSQNLSSPPTLLFSKLLTRATKASALPLPLHHVSIPARCSLFLTNNPNQTQSLLYLPCISMSRSRNLKSEPENLPFLAFPAVIRSACVLLYNSTPQHHFRVPVKSTILH